MHAPVWQALRAAVIKSCPTVYRSPIHRRYPHSQRCFRTSHGRLLENDPLGNPEVPEAVRSNVAEGSFPISKDDVPPSELEKVAESTGGTPPVPPDVRDRSGYGSASRRASRNVRKKEIPPPELPQWFLDRNVRLWEVGCEKDNVASPSIDEDADTSASPEVETSQGSLPDRQTLSDSSPVYAKLPASDQTAHRETSVSSYALDKYILREIEATVSVGLLLPYDANAASSRAHVILHCPEKGGTYFLDSVVRHIASVFDADTIRLDPQDIAEIGGRYMPEFRDSRGNTLSGLGYEAYLTTTMREAQESESLDEEEEADDAEEEEDTRRPKSTAFQRPSVGIVPIAQFSGNLTDVLKNLVSFRGAVNDGSPQTTRPGSSTSVMKMLDSPDTTVDIKTSMLIDSLLSAVDLKRAAKSQDANSSIDLEDSLSRMEHSAVSQLSQDQQLAVVPMSDLDRHPKNLIIFIRDYQEISLTQNGRRFLDQLHESIQRRRQNGQRIVIVGTTAANDLIPSYTKSGIRRVQSDQGNGSTRTIVTPPMAATGDANFAQQAKARVQDINIRHLRDMICRTTHQPSIVDNVTALPNLQAQIDSGVLFSSGSEESVWSMDTVHRIATLALGLIRGSRELTVQDIEQALSLIDTSDNVKFTWAEKANEEERKSADPAQKDGLSPADIDERMKKLRKSCNKHEKKLLHGVVNPESIRTTFADVRATPQTLEALKTLTSLSLVRPDAFTYGVLATDRISGLLLYGPPGTGKTLLAKAVAKESGATVLEVSGSDVYDMYVGEGEKNIRAIFTLAKKLSPCVVFIDEADAILGSRGGSSNRTTHRELINQFLREWDGMTDTSAFIMVATNRPFDLDEASLRRLPRRLLVDLPTEKDREAILAIHLKDETLHSDISLATLASQTPFYSGSDLKNLCVAAALACVREEFDTAAAAKGDAEAYKYPEKRTLEQRHFDKAMEEISASISEDMGSLSAIRKFDEKYGDRRGRRKKGSGYGFGTIKESERNLDGSARVRNQT